MYNLSTVSGTGLAVTGATIGFHVTAAWTLLVAGIALIYTVRVLKRRAALRYALVGDF